MIFPHYGIIETTKVQIEVIYFEKYCLGSVAPVVAVRGADSKVLLQRQRAELSAVLK